MSEADITQHIISASRGSLGDLGQALSDIHQRLITVEAAGYLAAASVAEIWASDPYAAMTPQNFTSSMTPVTLTDGATVTPDFDAGRNFFLEFDANTTIANPTNGRLGQTGTIWLKQGTSAKTVSWGDSWDFVGTPVAATGAGAVSVVNYVFHSPTSILAVMISA